MERAHVRERLRARGRYLLRQSGQFFCLLRKSLVRAPSPGVPNLHQLRRGLNAREFTRKIEPCIGIFLGHAENLQVAFPPAVHCRRGVILGAARSLHDRCAAFIECALRLRCALFSELTRTCRHVTHAVTSNWLAIPTPIDREQMLHCKKMLKKRDQTGEEEALRAKREHASFRHVSYRSP